MTIGDVLSEVLATHGIWAMLFVAALAVICFGGRNMYEGRLADSRRENENSRLLCEKHLDDLRRQNARLAAEYRKERELNERLSIRNENLSARLAERGDTMTKKESKK